MYQISKLINQVISGNKQRKREIVLKLGYKNLDKGYRRLYHLIETGECPEPIKKMLPTALVVEPQVVEDAFETTSQQIAEEVELARRRQEEYERRTFKPHLWIEHEREYPPPGTIWIVALSGLLSYKFRDLHENINEFEWDERVRLVQERIRRHQEEEGTYNRIFGKVDGYTYRQTYDDSFLFSKDGEHLRITFPIGLKEFKANDEAKALYAYIYKEKYEEIARRIGREDLPTIEVTIIELDEYRLRFKYKIYKIEEVIEEAIKKGMIKIKED